MAPTSTQDTDELTADQKRQAKENQKVAEDSGGHRGLADGYKPKGEPVTGGRHLRPQNGFIDQRTRRSVQDVMEGHFCTIDRTNKGVNTDVLPAGEDGYGVYQQPVTVDKDGYPETVLVSLRGEAAGQVVQVPYDSLRPADAGRR